MLVRLKDGKWTDTGLRANLFSNPESVCALEAFNGELWANTERNGEVFSSKDGMTWRKRNALSVGHTGCGAKTYKGNLYLSGANSSARAGRVYVKSGEHFKPIGQPLPYVRHLENFGGDLHAFTINTRNQPRWYRLRGNRWETESKFNHNRVFKTYVDGDKLWLGFAKYYSGTPSGVGIYRKGTIPIMLYQNSNYSHFGAIIAGYRPNGNKLIFAGASKNWKKGGSSRIFILRAGKMVGQLPDIRENWIGGFGCHNRKIFVGAWSGDGYRGHGAVYRVKGVSCR